MKFPKSINVNGKSIKKNSRITEELNKHFTNVGPNLASKIRNTSKTFEDFLFPVQKNIEYRDFTFEEFEKAFKSVKRNKTAGHDDINSNITIKIYDENLLTVNHSILLHRLELYEIKGKCLNWLKSYLKHRQQFVSLGK